LVTKLFALGGIQKGNFHLFQYRSLKSGIVHKIRTRWLIPFRVERCIICSFFEWVWVIKFYSESSIVKQWTSSILVTIFPIVLLRAMWWWWSTIIYFFVLFVIVFFPLFPCICSF
jgi:hypothetical protein